MHARGRVEIEDRSRVERAVAQKFKNRPVELIRSGLRDCDHLRARALSVFCRIGSGEDVELADGVDSQQISADAAGCIGELAGAGVFNSIQQKNVFQRPASRNRERVALTGDGAGTLVGVIDGSGLSVMRLSKLRPLSGNSLI